MIQHKRGVIVFSYFLFILLVLVKSATINENVMKIKRTVFENSEKNNSSNTEIKPENRRDNGHAKEESLDRRIFFPPDLHRIISALDALPKGLCLNDSRAVLEAVVSRQRWALKMFDASPKFPVGMLHGSYYQLGNFDECISITESLSQSKRTLKGQYCIADIALDPENGKDERIARSNGHFHDHGPLPRIALNNTLHWAVCTPSTCNPEEVQQFLEALFKIAISYKAINVQVPELRCYYEKTWPVTNLEIIYGCVIGMFLVFVLLASFYHLLRIYNKTRSLNYNVDTTQNKPRSKTICQEIILSFSLIKNIRKLLYVSSSDLNLDCISGIKFLSMMLIVSSHSLLFIISGPVINEEFYTEAVKKPQNAILLNNPLLVDTFLLLSGFLMSRLLLLELEKRKGKINILFLYIARYIRLTPSYLVVILLYCTFLVRLDSGPLWNDIISTERDRCLKSWWTNILYINNYVNTDNICMFQSWYLSADTHLFIIAPFIIYPLWKWQRIGEILLGGVTIIVAVIPGIITYIYELDPTLMAFPSEIIDITRNSYFTFAYIKTHMRATSYCIGLIAGYMVHRLQSSNTKLSSSVVRLSWILATIFGISSVYSITIFYLPEHEYNSLESAAYSSLHKIGWSASIGWIIVACVTDHSGPVKKFLSWAPFGPLSRLTYCAYLVNGLIELHSYGTVRTPIHMSVYSLACTTLAHFLMTFAAGLILCVLFESPIHGLEKILLRQDHKKKSSIHHQPQLQMVDNAKL